MKWLKKILVPSGQQVELEGIETWMVRWKSVIVAPFGAQAQDRAQAFTSEEDAKAFKKALEDANKLLRNCFDLQVKITKEE